MVMEPNGIMQALKLEKFTKIQMLLFEAESAMRQINFDDECSEIGDSIHVKLNEITDKINELKHEMRVGKK